jgi:hypothetical protein
MISDCLSIVALHLCIPLIRKYIFYYSRFDPTQHLIYPHYNYLIHTIFLTILPIPLNKFKSTSILFNYKSNNFIIKNYKLFEFKKICLSLIFIAMKIR